ncbi:MAG: MnhB domain-containing protein [Candidatus Methanofastidiosia archaeon]
MDEKMEISIKKRMPERSNIIVSNIAILLFPFILAYGVYIFLFGHLSPGGGFQGGAIIASGMALMYMGNEKIKQNTTLSKILDSILIPSICGLIIVIVGLFGIVRGDNFLQNFFPKGQIGTMLSAGFIPLIYALIGLKVAFELSTIVENFNREEDHEP